MICFPLDNTQYDASAVGSYMATRTRGVLSADANLSVTADGSSMAVSVSAGLAWLKHGDYWGTAALLQQPQPLTISAADGALSRIDAIVCRLDKVGNAAEIVVKKGSYAASPTVVDPVRDDNYDEIYLATVSVASGTTAITQALITDQRLNETYCGLMRDGITGIPTAQLQAQGQELIDQLKVLLQSTLDGASQMLKTVYDPQGKNTDIFSAIETHAAAKASGTTSGHVTLSDSTASTSGAADGIAATPAAVKATKDAAASAASAASAAQSTANSANTTANAAMPKSGGNFSGSVMARTTLRTISEELVNVSVRNSSWQSVSSDFLVLIRK